MAQQPANSSHSDSPLTARWRMLLLLLFLSLSWTACGKRPPPSYPPPDTGPSQPGPGPADETEREDAEVGAPRLDLRVDPERIEPGDSALLIWESRRADRVVIEPGIGPVDPSGRIRFYPDRTTTYRVVAEGPGGAVTMSATIRVGRPGDDIIAEEDLRSAPLEERFARLVRPVYFGFDSTELSDEARLTLDANFEWLSRPENRQLSVVIEGHTDERGSEEYNLALGDQRAAVVRDYLIGRGMDPQRISVVSLGEEKPFDPRQTEKAFALNRRAEFVLLDTGDRN